MTVSKRRRRAHDPWGNKYGNNHSIITLQFAVGHKAKNINMFVAHIDLGLIVESSGAKFVMAKKNPERIRR